MNILKKDKFSIFSHKLAPLWYLAAKRLFYLFSYENKNYGYKIYLFKFVKNKKVKIKKYFQ